MGTRTPQEGTGLRLRVWRLLFLYWSTGWWVGTLQGHLGGHLTGSLASGQVRLPLLSPLFPLEQPPLPLILLHSHHVAVGRAWEGVSGCLLRCSPPFHSPEKPRALEQLSRAL